MTDTMPDTMRAVALVKIHAFGLNRMDLLQREGHYPLPPNAPTILGVEFSGTIVSLPSSPASTTNHHSFEVGSPVFGLAPAAPTQTAAVPETWMTATQALDFVLGGINDPASNKKKSILWHAGASGVSIAGIQLSRLAGAEKVFATAGTGEKCRNVKDVDIGALLFKRVRVEGSTLRSRDEEYQGRLRDRLEEYLPRFESGELKVLVDTVLPWEEIVKAHQLLEENKTMGKIICTIS
ncbi:hypothetical protein N0V88_000925 [Collariella sp. IMI 366227]|nr:hypothetical protein N0V88_000925 [Collariella sp. IMI 366227]